MNIDLYTKIMSRIENGGYTSKELDKLYSNSERQGGEQAKNIMSAIVKYSERHEISLYKKLVPESDVNRKSFMQDNGFTCANWLWSWSFINESEKLIAFGAWNTAFKDSNNVVVLSENWKGEDRAASGYVQALKHIEFIDTEGYELVIFNMIHGGEDANGRSKIAGIDPVLRSAKLRKEGVDWIATIA